MSPSLASLPNSAVKRDFDVNGVEVTSSVFGRRYECVLCFVFCLCFMFVMFVCFFFRLREVDFIIILLFILLYVF
jgi:hypothetical protein